jgi:hypothetical protein
VNEKSKTASLKVVNMQPNFGLREMISFAGFKETQKISWNIFYPFEIDDDSEFEVF